MHASTDSSLLGRATPLFRLFTLVLAALALAISEQPVDANVATLAAAYAAVSVLSVAALRRLDWQWLAFAAFVIDIAAITAFTVLAPAVTLPVWVLYLLPIISAATLGPLAAAASAGLSGAGYIAGRWTITGAPTVSDLWPLAILVIAALLAISSSAHLLAERRKKRAWQEVAASLRTINGIWEPENAANTVADEVRRAVGADFVWLWVYENTHYSTPYYSSGTPGEDYDAPAIQDLLTPALSSKLKKGPVGIAELGGRFSDMSGEAISLDRAGVRIAVLAAGWRQAPQGLHLRREQLRILAPSLAAGLARCWEVAFARESLRLEGALLEAASELMDTLDPNVAQEAALAAVRSTLGVSAALTSPASKTVVAGDQEAACLLARLNPEARPLDADAEAAPPDSPSPSSLVAAEVGDGLAMAAWRDGSAFENREVDWLERVAAMLGRAVERCAEHERVRAEEALLRATIEAIPAPCSVWGSGGRLLMANRAQRLLGSPESIPALKPSPTGTHEAEIEAGDPPRTFVVMKAQVPRTHCTISVLREITQEREALRAKEELIAMAGHELRSPLTSISGYSQMMARQLAVVQRQVTQINSLIGDFLEASQLDGGQLRIEAEPIDLADLVRMAAERFSGSNEERRLRLELSEVPSLEGDASRLAQVVDNLLSNAAKYSPADEEIVLALKRDGDRALISVSDRGVGVAPEHLPRLFDRFYRVRNSDTEHVKGLGLGLAIVHDIVTAHGGRAWAESAGPGQGSTFCVSLPLPVQEEVTPQLEPTGTTG